MDCAPELFPLFLSLLSLLMLLVLPFLPVPTLSLTEVVLLDDEVGLEVLVLGAEVV